jgi:serine/threonine protein kinase
MLNVPQLACDLSPLAFPAATLGVASARVSPEIAAVADGALIGHCIDERYCLEAVIGVGGLGSVYRATHTKLQRPVAVKLLHETFGESQIQRGRFAREAKALAALQHPNIVAVLDYGVSEARPYLVMELLEGETLSQRLHEGPLQVEAALQVVQQLLEALSFMHRARLVHRDVKPSNVFLLNTPDGPDRVKVLDFGLAKFTATPMMVNTDPTLTRDGAILGTPAYMSPEQATGEIVDARSDVYAVGVILFRMLAGRLPFEGDAIEQVRSHLIAPVPPLNRPEPEPELDSALEALICRAMAKRREDRFTDAGEMLRALVERFPQYVHPSLPEHEPVLPDPFAVDALNADWLLSVTDISSETPTLPRDARPPAEFARGSVQRVTRAIRMLVITSLRLVAGASVLLVIGAGAIFVLLLRSDADRAELSALQRRVSDRLIERSTRRGADAPQAGTGSEPSGDGKSRAGGSDKGTALVAVPAHGGGPSGLAIQAPGLGSTPQPSAAAPALAPNPPAPADAPPGAEPARAALASAEPPAPEPAPPFGLERMPLPLGIETSVSAIEQAEAAKLHEVPVSSRLTAALERAGTAGSAALELEPPPSAAGGATDAKNAPANVPAVDPWLQPLPAKLRPARKSALANGRGSENMILSLREYNKDQRDDPRGHLLLGQLYLNRFWRADALAQFSTALAIDPSARGAPEVLNGLMMLVMHGGLGSEAERVIINRFGSEAVPAIDKALADAKEPKLLSRLRWLRSRVTN